MLRQYVRALPLLRLGAQRTIYSSAKDSAFGAFRPFESLTPVETQQLMRAPPPSKPSSPAIKNDIVLSYLEKEGDSSHNAMPLYIRWGTFNSPKQANQNQVDPYFSSDRSQGSPRAESEDMSLESTKRKRKRKMNKHKHRKNLKKMKFTLRKIGRK